MTEAAFEARHSCNHKNSARLYKMVVLHRIIEWGAVKDLAKTHKEDK